MNGEQSQIFSELYKIKDSSEDQPKIIQFISVYIQIAIDSLFLQLPQQNEKGHLFTVTKKCIGLPLKDKSLWEWCSHTVGCGDIERNGGIGNPRCTHGIRRVSACTSGPLLDVADDISCEGQKQTAQQKRADVDKRSHRRLITAELRESSCKMSPQYLAGTIQPPIRQEDPAPSGTRSPCNTVPCFPGLIRECEMPHICPFQVVLSCG